MFRQPQRAQRQSRLISGAAGISKLLCLCLLAAAMSRPAFAADAVHAAANLTDARSAHRELQSGPGHRPVQVALEWEAASEDVHHLAAWVIEKTDNHGLPFLIVDKVRARVFVFDVAGNLRGAAPALLGMALGDDAIAGIRNLKMTEIGPRMRVTPAGRFLASLGHDPAGKEILWVDYDNSIALHAVVTNNPKERRLQRLASAIPLDHRISWGCINVPKMFYEKVVSPSFRGTQGIVYVMPEIRIASEVFGFK
jgi:hypothetical protein